MIEAMCKTLNKGHYGAAVMTDPDGAFDAIRRKGLIYIFTLQVLKHVPENS